MNKIIKVGMADLNICKNPDKITTLGLGSCVGIVLYDPIKKVGGLAHAMLPDSTQIKNNSNKAKFVDTSIVKLLNLVVELGAKEKSIYAKIAGGAQMFNFNSQNDLMKIGYRNTIAAKEMLKKLNIPLISEDTGKNYGRTIILDTANGDLTIKTVGKGIRII